MGSSFSNLFSVFVLYPGNLGFPLWDFRARHLFFRAGRFRGRGSGRVCRTFGQEVELGFANLCPKVLQATLGLAQPGFGLLFFRIGMDAEVSYGSHHLQNTKPYISLSSKLLYSICGCAQGWFCTKCVDNKGTRRIKRILCLHYKKAISSEWEQMIIPYDVRSIVVLNNRNYGNGRNPWGHPKTEHREERGFVEPKVDDGILEIIGFKHGWHASFVMVKLIDAIHLAQASEIKFELRGCEPKKHVYMQTDGEPWKHEISTEFSTFVHITRVPHQTLMINGE